MSHSQKPHLEQWFETARQEPLAVDKNDLKSMVESGQTLPSNPSLFDQLFTLKHILIMSSTIAALGVVLWLTLPILQSNAQSEPSIPHQFPILELPQTTLTQLGFSFTDERMLYMTQFEDKGAFYYDLFQTPKSKVNPDDTKALELTDTIGYVCCMSFSGTKTTGDEPLSAIFNNQTRTYPAADMIDGGFYAMYATDLEGRQIFSLFDDVSAEDKNKFSAFVPIKVGTGMVNPESGPYQQVRHDSLIFYFTPTEAFFNALPAETGAFYRGIQENVMADENRNLYLYRPMHIETYLQLSEEELTRLGLTFEPDGCWTYAQNIHVNGKTSNLTLIQDVAVGVSPTKADEEARSYYPLFVSDLTGQQETKYRVPGEPLGKSNEAYLRMHHDNLMPVLVPDNDCSGDLLLWFHDTPEFWEAIEAAPEEKTVLHQPKVRQFNLQKLEVYPNPARDLLNLAVTLTTTDQISINLIDLQGRIVQPLLPIQQQVAGDATYSFNLHNLPAGVYIILLDSEQGGRMTQRVQIK